MIPLTSDDGRKRKSQPIADTIATTMAVITRATTSKDMIYFAPPRAMASADNGSLPS
jgi:hypothetical protein